LDQEPSALPIRGINDNSMGADLGGAYAILSAIVTDFSQGDLKPTNDPLNLALEGPGFFVVETPQGVRYTRNGAFSINGKGQLTTHEGYPLEGKGNSNLLSGALSIDSQGNISVDGDQKGSLKIVEFENSQEALQKQGDNLYVLKLQEYV
jgi:flagellar basal-body rod protein FlgG